MTPYALLLIAGAWHALGIGTVGLRGRIVAVIIAVGMLWGVLTPPWGWIQIGAAVASIGFGRWSVTDRGRVFLVASAQWLIAWTAEFLRGVVRMLWWILSPPRAHEDAPVERAVVVPTPGDTVELTLQHGDRWGMLKPLAGSGDTAQVSSMTPVETYHGVVAEAATRQRQYNEAARYVKSTFNVSRSTFARDVRPLRESSGERKAA